MRSVYLIPNLLTTGNFFCGIVAIVNALNGNFTTSCVWILLAMFFDFLDGHIARITLTTSKFGEQYDSLSDLITFGLAPTIIIYEMTLHRFGRFGLAIAFIYAVCCALRLARYNSRLKPAVKKKYFDGLPTPAAAMLICSCVLASARYDLRGVIAAIPFLMLMASFLMVSNVSYPTVQAIGLKKKKPFFSLVLVVLTIGGLIFFIELFLMVSSILYAMSGLVDDWLPRRIREPKMTIQADEVREQL